MKFRIDRRETSPSWVLPKEQAQTFAPATAGILRVTAGRAWVTMSTSHLRSEAAFEVALVDEDLFIDSTTSLPLQAGKTIVMESWSVETVADATLVWEAAVFTPGAQRWQQTVAQPAREIGQGLKQTGLAFVKLISGLFSYTVFLSARRSHLL